MDELASWFAVCAEGVYGTRPWRVCAEGGSGVKIEDFTEEAVAWQPTDFRFTCKGKTLFAFMMQAPENCVAVVRSLAPEEKVQSVRLLGGENLAFSQNFGALTVQLPQELPAKYANCLAVELG